MAGRLTSAFYYVVLILHLVLLTECNYGVRFGDKARRLHVAEDGDSRYRRPHVIDRRDDTAYSRDDDGETSFERTRRDVQPPEQHPNNNPNITTKVHTLRCCTREDVASRRDATWRGATRCDAVRCGAMRCDPTRYIATPIDRGATARRSQAIEQFTSQFDSGAPEGERINTPLRFFRAFSPVSRRKNAQRGRNIIVVYA